MIEVAAAFVLVVARACIVMQCFMYATSLFLAAVHMRDDADPTAPTLWDQFQLGTYSAHLMFKATLYAALGIFIAAL